MSNDRFFWKNRLTLGQIISGTKRDRDKLIFSPQRGGQYDRVGHNKGPNGIGKCKKRGSIERSGSSPPSSSMNAPHPLGVLLTKTYFIIYVGFKLKITIIW